MGENPGVPGLFRDIFKNAYLPYKDPETLRAFLKEINGFSYENSERLGDAFEYLLSVMGSQGDAGQFRTPRHLIDFIVQVVDPQKGETVLDPACGTAGFLISAFKHILQANQKNHPGDLLTADERTRLAQNLTGYDISPDMVRLSLANLYLHGFPDPQVEEYDTLTSDDQWNEYADVILANPPFMSPKGGIKPHKRFSVPSNRNEVLFLDYIAEHLTPTGRAGVIVPEGIIFQSGTSYKTLRKMLVDKHLIAVVSFPAGVFQPYSGVKTSVLILDRKLAKTSDSILFVKIASDGFGLGAQWRAVATDDLPEAARLLGAWREGLRDGTGFDAGNAANVQVVAKAKIAESGNYHLGGDRYRDAIVQASHFPLVALGEVADLEKGTSITKKDTTDGLFPVIAGGQQLAYYHNEYNREGQTITVSASGAYAGFVNYFDGPIFASDCSTIKVKDAAVLDPIYLFRLLKTKQAAIYAMQAGAGQPHVYAKDLRLITIPLPPLDIQREIVAEIEGYQKIIDGARQVVKSYTPRIDVRPEWPVVELGNFAEVKGEKRLPKGEAFSDTPTEYPYIRVSDFKNLSVDTGNLKHISPEIRATIGRYTISHEDVYISIAGTIGLFGTVPDCLNGASLTENAAKIIINSHQVDKKYLVFVGMNEVVRNQVVKLTHAVGVPKFALERIRLVQFPLPDLDTQRAIVAEIEQEQRLVNSTKELIPLFEAKIKTTIGRVGGDAAPVNDEVKEGAK